MHSKKWLWEYILSYTQKHKHTQNRIPAPPQKKKKKKKNIYDQRFEKAMDC